MYYDSLARGRGLTRDDGYNNFIAQFLFTQKPITVMGSWFTPPRNNRNRLLILAILLDLGVHAHLIKSRRLITRFRALEYGEEEPE